jgi:predicted nuclease with TOPRIM domain
VSEKKRDELEAENAKLLRENERLKKELEKKAAELEKLRKEIADLRRAAHRQATPFARRSRARKRRKPGRPSGHAPASQAVPDHVDESVEAPLDECRVAAVTSPT